jgi:hypothetical protein
MSGRTKKNHYLPISAYLSGFTNKNGQICVFDKKQGKWLPPQCPKDVGYEKNLYLKSTEEFLAKNIENISPLCKIQNWETLSIEQKKKILKFILVLWLRVPEVKKKNDKDLADSCIELLSAIKKAKIPYLSDEAEKLSQKPLPQNMSESFFKEPETIFPLGFKTFLNCDWKCYFCNEIITNDNPVNMFGLGKGGIILPISSKSFLAIDKSLKKSILASTSRELNKRTFFNASQFVYSSSEKNFISKWSKQAQICQI